MGKNKNLVQIVIVVLLVLGVIVGVYLVQRSQVLVPQATEEIPQSTEELPPPPLEEVPVPSGATSPSATP